MKIYQVDAFAQEKFKGNPAAVCVVPDDFNMQGKAEEQWMQNVGAEMNLSETAFVQKLSKLIKPTKLSKNEGVGSDSENTDPVFKLRWFTPKTEVDLCGHATLATAHILWQEGLLKKDQLAKFDTRSGRLEVRLNDSQMTMNFPVDEVTKCKEPVGLEMALGCAVLGVYEAGQDLLVEVADEQTVLALKPSLQQLTLIPVRCTIVTAHVTAQVTAHVTTQGKSVDFVSRVFGPAVGINEDPVTGSTHCSLTPFWSERLGKTKMKALQLSQRGGALGVELIGDRVAISGQAVTIFKGELCD